MTLERDILENLPEYPRDNIEMITSFRGTTYNKAKGTHLLRADDITMSYLKELLQKVKDLESENAAFESRPPRKITMLHITHSVIRVLDMHYNT